MQIIGNRDKDGNFIASADAWPLERIEALFDKLNPRRSERLAREAQMMTQEKGDLDDDTGNS